MQGKADARSRQRASVERSAVLAPPRAAPQPARRATPCRPHTLPAAQVVTYAAQQPSPATMADDPDIGSGEYSMH